MTTDTKRALLVVEPVEPRRHSLQAALGANARVVESAPMAQRALDSGTPVSRLVVALPTHSKRPGESERRCAKEAALALLDRARQLTVEERVLEARDCDLELYLAVGTIGTQIWPESTVEEASEWYRSGLHLDFRLRERVARDVARAQVCEVLDLTPTELNLVFSDLMDGGSYAELGSRLGVSVHTIKAHFRNIRCRTDLTRDELRTHALRVLLSSRGFVENECQRSMERTG